MKPIRIGSASRIEIGYDGENGARAVVFDATKWMDEMPGCTAAITAQRADGQEYIAPDVTQDEAERTITWTLTSAETMEGEGRAQLLWMDGERIAKQAIFTTVCHESLKSDATQIGVPEPVWAQQSLAAAQEARKSAEAAKVSEIGAQNALEETKGVRDAAKQEIDTKKEGALAGIENAKAEAIVSIEAGKDELAPPVIPEATGTSIVATDSADRPLRGLTVYGKTTQDGTPSEDAPVDLMGVGTDSPLRIVTAGKNLAALTTRVGNTLGITSSYDAQTGVLTVTGTATGLAFVSYWLREPIPAGVPLVIGLGNGSSDSNMTIRAYSASESANTNIGTLSETNRVINKVFTHAFEFFAIRIETGATVDMKLQIGVTVGINSAGYTWTHPDDPTSAQIIMPGLHIAVGGLLHGVPAVSGGNYTDENGQQWIADTVEYDAETGTAQLVQRVGSVTFDGSADEDWGVTYGYQALCISVANAARISHGLCTHFEGMDIKNDQTAIGFSAATDDGLIAFRPNDVAHMILDIGVWRARLAESPVTVLYALAEPVTMPITGDELAALAQLRSRYPETTMYNDAGAQMAARYIADTKKYVDDADAEIAKAVIDVDGRVDAAMENIADAGKRADAAQTKADENERNIGKLKDDLLEISPDDGQVGGKPWTSKHIIDMLCPAIEETGNPVQVYPVENYPLGVKVSWEPTQAGEGDPSPDNIRPITGKNAISVTRCGKNLIDYSQMRDTTSNGITYTKQPDGGIRVAGTASKESFCQPLYYTSTALPAGTYTAKLIGSKNTSMQVVIKRASGSNVWLTGTFKISYGDILLYTYIRVAAGLSCDETVYPILVAGDITPTAYEPYTGSTTDIALPEAVYGGELDVETGVLTVDRAVIKPDGDSLKFTSDGSGAYWNLPQYSTPGILRSDTELIVSSHFVKKFFGNESREFLFTKSTSMSDLFDTVDGFNAYIADQYAAGTPVQIVYPLKDPRTIQIDKHQIAALSGVNTVYTDADGVTVTGREDPKHTITELRNAIISLGGNV